MNDIDHETAMQTPAAARWLWLLCLPSLLACSADHDDDRRALLRSWGEDVLLPDYRDVEAATATLEARAAALCDAVGTAAVPAELAAARDAWSRARQPWKETEVFSFGPYTDEPLRLGPKLDFWPARPDNIEALLTGSDPITVEAVEAGGVTTRGLPVIEYLLFEPGADVAAAFDGDPRRCDYLRALTVDVGRRATDMRAAWDPAEGDFLGELVDAGRGRQTFASSHEALSEVVNRMIFTLENIRSEKLGRPLGTTTGGAPQPDKIESVFSGRSLDDIRDNLRGVESLYYGADTSARDDARAPLGLDDYARALGHDFDAAMRARLDAAYASVDAIEVSLIDAIFNQPVEVGAAIDELGALQRLIQVDIINALSLTLTFNDNDGD